MAQGDWTYFTHGVNVIVEDPGKIGSIQRLGWGTLVSQQAPSDNWFHFPIPTANQLNGTETVKHLSAFLQAKLNENAHIIAVHVWVGDRRVVNQDGLDLRGPEILHQVELPHDQVRDRRGHWSGMVVCARVGFLSGVPSGDILFEGAGVTFERS